MQTLAHDASFEQEIKKSRFIAFAARVDSTEQAIAWIESRRRPDANHNCWAWRIGTEYRFNDDGEPASTAGRPILAAIEGQAIDHAAVLVVRYFGGIKLGAGGLIRAYGGTAAACLRGAEIREVVPHTQIEIHGPFETSGSVHALLERRDLDRLDEQFDVAGFRLRLRAPTADLPELRQQLRNATRGNAQLIVIKTPGKDDA